ncbi:MAG: hypothetical protein AB8H79_21695 [Myxococcota bacterium]
MAVEEGRYQMLWDCPACGTDQLLGLDHRFCPNCGSAQDPGLRYFPSDDAKIAVDDHPYHGADKVCPACDTPNGAASEFCQACGSDLDGSKAAAVRGDVVLGEDESFAGQTAQDAKDEARERKRKEEARRRGEDPDPPKKKSGLFGMGLAGTGCLILVLLMIFGCAGYFCLSSLWSSSGEVTVAGHAWKREINVEAFGPQKGSAWEDRVPRGATSVRCSKEVKDTKKVADGETCKTRKVDKGDGTFAEKKECTPKYRSEKIYGQKCRFMVNEWKKSRTAKAQGTDLNPLWPNARLSQVGDCVGCEREGRRTDTYSLRVTDESGAEHKCDLSEAKWRSYTKGQRVEASFGGLTGAIDCSSF